MPGKENAPRRRGRVEDLGAGRFKVTVNVGCGPGGKRLYRRKTLRDSTPAKAAAYARNVAAQADRGDYLAPSKMTLKELAAEALERARRKGLRQTTLENMERRARLHILPGLGAETPLARITPEAVQRFYDRLADALALNSRPRTRVDPCKWVI